MERCGEHELKEEAAAAVWPKSGGLQKNYLAPREWGLTTRVVNIDKQQIYNEKRQTPGTHQELR